MIRSQAHAVTSVATHVAFDDDTRQGEGVAVFNVGPDLAYLGGPDVTPANGYPVAAGVAHAYDTSLSIEDELWAVCAEGDTAELRSFRVGA